MSDHFWLWSVKMSDQLLSLIIITDIYSIYNLLLVTCARNAHILHSVSNVCACATIIGGICNDLSDTDTSYCAPICRYPISWSHYRYIPTTLYYQKENVYCHWPRDLQWDAHIATLHFHKDTESCWPRKNKADQVSDLADWQTWDLNGVHCCVAPSSQDLNCEGYEASECQLHYPIYSSVLVRTDIMYVLAHVCGIQDWEEKSNHYLRCMCGKGWWKWVYLRVLNDIWYNCIALCTDIWRPVF